MRRLLILTSVVLLVLAAGHLAFHSLRFTGHIARLILY